MPENRTLAPAVNCRVDIYGLTYGPEGKGSLFVGEDEEQPKQYPVDASGRGDDRRQEGVARAGSRRLKNDCISRRASHCEEACER